ncbi:MAG: hypothetical protein V1721_03625 [Pseudomonadota bacterium]
MPPKKSVVIKEVLTDPGVDFNIANVVLFAGISKLGLEANVVALGISVVSKILDETKPAYLQKLPKFFQKILHDPKTTLFTSGIALTIVGVAALASGATGAWIPAAAGFLAAAGKFTTAESLASAEREKNKKGDASPTEKNKRGWLSTFLRRPDLYINASFAVAGLMSGGATLLVLPVIAVSGWIAYQNSRQNKPEYTGYPLVLAAAAAAFHAGVGIMNGNWLPGISAAMAAAVLLNIECRLTPGGGKKILSDIKGSLARLLGRGKKAENAPAKMPTPSIVQSPEKILPANGDLSIGFNVTAANENIPSDLILKKTKSVPSHGIH